MRTEKEIVDILKSCMSRIYENRDLYYHADFMESCIELVKEEKACGNKCWIIQWLDEKLGKYDSDYEPDVFKFYDEVDDFFNRD